MISTLPWWAKFFLNTMYHRWFGACNGDTPNVIMNVPDALQRAMVSQMLYWAFCLLFTAQCCKDLSCSCMQDIFSMGCVLAEMFLDGKLLFDRPQVKSQRRFNGCPYQLFSPLLNASTVQSYVCIPLRSVHDTQNCKACICMFTLHSEAFIACARLALTVFLLLSCCPQCNVVHHAAHVRLTPSSHFKF